MSIGLALSGGGFRATLFHLGVIAYLRDAEVLPNVSHITSVSGGSILAAHLVLNWDSYSGSKEAFEAAVAEIISFVQRDVRGRVYRRAPMHIPFRVLPHPSSTIYRRGRLIPVESLRKSTTDLLVDHYAELYRNATLAHLGGGNRPMLYLLTTNQTDGTLCSFTRYGFQDESVGREVECDSISLARAVAASSAFPGLFPSVSLTPENSGIPREDLRHREVLLTDGGVYDNLGVRKFHSLLESERIKIDNVVVSDASSQLKMGYRGGLLEPLRTSMRAADILSKRINELERRYANGSMFRMVYIGERVSRSVDQEAIAEVLQRELISVRTDLDKFSDLEISCLVRHGYCVARAKLRQSENETALSAPPPWDPLPDSKDPDVTALREGRIEQYERIRQRLDRSALRRLRVVAANDTVTYIQALTVVVLIAALLFYAPALALLSDTNTTRRIENEITSLRESYREELTKRRFVGAGGLPGYDPAAAESDSADHSSTLTETWNTSQATYVFLRSSSALDPAEIAAAEQLLRSRFVAVPNGDYVSGVDGWFGRPSLPHLQAEPALWTAAAIARLLQFKELSEDSRSEFKALLKRVEHYLRSRHFYDPASTTVVAFNVLGNQTDTTKHSAYSTSLALLMMIEVHRAGEPWGNARPATIINGLVKWLNERYIAGIPPGWKPLDGDMSNSISQAVSLQILATLLEAYLTLKSEIPPQLHLRIRDQLLQVEKNDGCDSRANVRLIVTDHEDRETPAEPSIAFLNRPWAIRLSRLWLYHIDDHTARENDPLGDEFRSNFREALYRMVVENGASHLRNDRQNMTFVNSEMLFALSPLPEF